MMKRGIIIMLLLMSALAKGQIYQTDPSYGKNFSRVNITGILHLPGDTTLIGSMDPCRQIAIVSGIVYTYNCDSLKWTKIKGTSDGAVSLAVDSAYRSKDTLYFTLTSGDTLKVPIAQNLQQVTNGIGDNVTSNGIVVTNQNNLADTTGLHSLFYGGSSGLLYSGNITKGTYTPLLIYASSQVLNATGDISISAAGSLKLASTTGVVVNSETPVKVTSTPGDTSTRQRVKAADAVDPDDLTTRRQMDSLASVSTVTASNGLTKIGQDIQLGGTYGDDGTDRTLIGNNGHLLDIQATSGTNFNSDASTIEARINSNFFNLDAVDRINGQFNQFRFNRNGTAINSVGALTVLVSNASRFNVTTDSTLLSSSYNRIVGSSHFDTVGIGRRARYKLDILSNSSVFRWDDQRLDMTWDTAFRRNTLIGYSAGKTATTFIQSVMTGYQAGFNNLGNYNTMTGYQSGVNHNGTYNSFYGFSSGTAYSGGRSTGVGAFALQNTDSTNNTGVGVSAGRGAYVFNSSFVGTDAGATTYSNNSNIDNDDYFLNGSVLAIAGTTTSTFISAAGLTTGYRGAAFIEFLPPYPVSIGGDTIRSFYTKILLPNSSTVNLFNAPGLQDNGSGGSVIHLSTKLNNVQVFGYAATADSSNQAVVGNTSVTQIKTGNARINVSGQGTAGQVLQSDGVQYRPVSLSISPDSSATLTVNNIDGLRANSFYTYPRKKTVYVKGYYSPGDAGGGWFYWDEMSTASDDSATVFLPTGYLGTGRWVRDIPGNVVNVRMFGAKGDRTTDDINSINSAAKYIATRAGGTVMFTTGQYLVMDSINSFNSNTRFKGDGSATIVYNNATRMGIKIRHDSCEVSGLNFTSDVVTVSTNVCAIFLQGASFCKVSNNRVYAPSGTGIGLFAGSSMHYNGRYASGCNYNIVENNWVTGMKQYINDNTDFSAILVGYASTFGDTANIIRNNHVIGNFLSGHGIGIIGAGYKNIIEGNEIRAFRQYGVVVYETANNDNFTLIGTNVINNKIDSIGVSSGSQTKGMGIYLQKGHKSIVVGNHISKTQLGGTTGSLAQAAITDAAGFESVIADNYIDSVGGTFAGIRINNAWSSTVRNNTIKNAQVGVFVEKSNYISVDNNTVVNSRGQGLLIRPDTSSFQNPANFRSLPTGVNLSITHNNIVSGSAGIDYAGTAASIGVGNKIKDNTINSVGAGILVSFLKKSQISDNIIGGSGGSNGIQIGTSCDSNTVSGNYIYKDAGSGGTFTTGISDVGANDRLYNNSIYNSSTRISFNGATFFPEGKVLYATAAPAAGTWQQGDRVYNISVTAASNVGWVCTSGGTPGTWTAWGAPSVSNNVYNTSGILTGNRQLTGKNNTYGLQFDSLSFFNWTALNGGSFTAGNPSSASSSWSYSPNLSTWVQGQPGKLFTAIMQSATSDPDTSIRLMTTYNNATDTLKVGTHKLFWTGDIVAPVPTYSTGGISPLGRNNTTGRFETIPVNLSKDYIVMRDFYADTSNTSTTPNTYNALYRYNIPGSYISAVGQKISARYGGIYASNGNSKGLAMVVNGVQVGANSYNPSQPGWQVNVTLVRTGSSTARVSFQADGYSADVDLTGLNFAAGFQFDLWGAGGGAAGDVTAKQGSISWIAAAP